VAVGISYTEYYLNYAQFGITAFSATSGTLRQAVLCNRRLSLILLAVLQLALMLDNRHLYLTPVHLELSTGACAKQLPMHRSGMPAVIVAGLATSYSKQFGLVLRVTFVELVVDDDSTYATNSGCQDQWTA
jgi:hypothetical protein